MIFVKMVVFKSLKAIVEESAIPAREAILAHKSDKKTIEKLLVLVEGVDDVPVYSVFLDEDKVDFKDCNGCENVEKQHWTLEKELGKKFISILDSDFRFMDSPLKDDDNLFFTDYHDSEMQMLSNKYVMPKAFQKITKRQLYGEDLVLVAEKEVYNLSMLKWYNSKRQFKYRFKPIDLVSLSHGCELTVNTVTQYVEPTKSSSKMFPSRTFAKFLTKNNKKTDVEALHKLSNGHDVVLRLSGILRHEYNTQVSKDNLRKAICQSFTLQIAKKTGLYDRVKKWCDKKHVAILK